MSSHLNSMLEQVRAIKSGMSLQGLLDAAYKILGNPIVMFNTEYNLLAHNDVETDDFLWNELVTLGTFSLETQKFFNNAGFIEDTANAFKSVLLASEHLKYDRLYSKLFNKNNTQVANLIMLAYNKPFGEHDQIVFEIICKHISKEISKSEEFEEYEQKHTELIIKKLIDGTFDKELDLSQAQIIYGSAGPYLYIAAADISCAPDCALGAAHYIKLLKQIKPAYKYAVYSGGLVILISTENEELNVNKELKELIKFFERHNIYAGISAKFENLNELQKHYADAKKALGFLLEARCSLRIFPCNESSMDRMERIGALTDGDGIQYFLDLGPEIFGNPLLFHDMELNLLAHTQNVEIIDPIWQELITYGTSSDETIKLFRTEGFISTMESTKGGAVLISDKIKYDRISWRIYNSDNIMIGCLSIVNTDTPFSDDELVLFGAFSQKFSKEARKLEFLNKYGQTYSETVINRLLSGKIDDYTFYSEDIGNLYSHLMENLYLVVVDTSQCESGQINLTYFRELFNWPGTLNRYAIYNDYIVIIISLENAQQNGKTQGCALDELSKLSKVFEQKNIYAGASGCFENIYDLQKHYKEAVTALKNGIKNKKQNSKDHIFRYEAEK